MILDGRLEFVLTVEICFRINHADRDPDFWRTKIWEGGTKTTKMICFGAMVFFGIFFFFFLKLHFKL